MFGVFRPRTELLVCTEFSFLLFLEYILQEEIWAE